MARNFWAVGSTFGQGPTAKNMTKEFIDKGVWWDGYADDGDGRYKSILDQINVGDCLVMKSSSTKGPGHSITFTKLKSIGIITSKKDYYYFNVKWLKNPELPLDFDKISYRNTIESLRDDDILYYANKKIKIAEMKETVNGIISILKKKSQIILQGPPGTGKTRLAKIVAEELVKPNIVGSPISIINNFFSTYDANNEQNKTEKTKHQKLLSEFQIKFPVESLNKLALDDYCAGKGDRNNFCWWIETGLKSLGKYSPGSARSYLIYWSKEDEEYKKHGKLIKDTTNDEEAMGMIAELLHDIVKSKNPESGIDYFGDSFLLKVLNSYYPDEYFPINGRESLDNALKLFGINSNNSSKFEKNKKLNELFKSKNQEFKSKVDAFDFMRFLFNNFNLKTGEDIDIDQTVISRGELQLIQFHPSYSYEDFVRGIMASVGEKGIEYKTENKILADFALKAIDNPNANYVLIIDELNRANLPSVLGELIYALEYRGEAVASMYEFEKEHDIILPQNLYIIGTMNTADRSVGHIDYAIRRRFAFINILPDPEVIIFDLAKQFFNEIKIFVEKNIANDFEVDEIMLGHSYFLAENNFDLKMKLKYEVYPILKEYIKDGIVNKNDTSVEELKSLLTKIESISE